MTCPRCNDDLGKTANNDEFCKGCGKFVKACSCEKKPERVSIIIPVYNAEKYIGAAIRNALRQTYQNTEVIVVDDGSTDKTILNLIRDPLSKNVKIIEKENGGVGSALNAGLKQMTGTWFKWLSADDLLERDCISTMMNYINQDTNAKNKIYYTHYRIIQQNGDFASNFIEPDRNSFSYLDKCATLLNNYYGNATTSLMHKSVVEKAGYFDEQIRNGDDYDFWLKSLFKHRIELHLIPKILASYRKHPEQLTNKRGVELYKTVEKIRKKNLLLLDVDFRNQVLARAKSLQKLPLKVRLRRNIRGVIFSLMPNKINNKILSEYQQRKKDEGTKTTDTR